MHQSKDQAVNDFLYDLQAHAAEQFDIVNAIREHMLTIQPDMQETIKYGGICSYRDNELITGIFVYKNHVSLEFSRGSELEDTYEVLEGSGKHRRHIKCNHLSDVDSKYVAHYLKATLN